MRNKLIVCSVIAALGIVGCSKEDGNVPAAGSDQTQLSSAAVNSVGTTTASEQSQTTESGKNINSVGSSDSQGTTVGSSISEQK